MYTACVLYTEFYLLLSNFLNSLTSACLLGIGFSKSSADNRWKMKVNTLEHDQPMQHVISTAHAKS